MARSVSTPANAELICYQHREFEDEWDGECLKEDVIETCKAYWKSLWECDKWLGRENHAILENELVYIGLSEYCGLVAIWIVPKDDYYGVPKALAFGWMGQIEKRFTEFFSELIYKGSFSNGEAVFSYRETPDRHITSKGYDNYNI